MSDDVGYMPGFVAHYLGAAIGKGGNLSEPDSPVGHALTWPFCKACMRFMCDHCGIL